MLRSRVAAAVLLGLGMQAALADEGVKVSGSRTRFAPVVAARVNGAPVRLVLTGTALRKRYGLSVYSIASYVQEGTRVRDAAGLSRVPAVKRLHMVFERAVDGPTIAKSFRDSIGKLYPAPAFAAELATLESYFRAYPIQQWDHVWLTSSPGVGLVCEVVGRPPVVIRDARFAQAAWDIYLGPRGLDVTLRTNLTSRL